MSALLRRLLYEYKYLEGRPPWDTGITPPELVELIEQEHLPPGRALDIGCGTGTNVVYLARHGFEATGIDFVRRAVGRAQRRAREAGVRAEFRVVNVLAPADLGPPFDFVLDIGCLHNFDEGGRPRYVENLRRWTRPGSHYLLYAFYPASRGVRQFGVLPAQLEQALAPGFRLIRSTAGQRQDQDSAWYYWERGEE